MAGYRPDLGTEVPRGSVVSAAVRAKLEGRRFHAGDAVFQIGLLLTLIIALGVLLTLLFKVTQEAWPVLSQRGGDFLVKPNSSLPFNAGVKQGLIGSLELMIFVLVFAVPTGIAAAVYMEEYAPDTRFTRLLNTNIRNLAGVPSIVYGLLGLAVFAQALRGLTGGTTVIAGGLTLAVLVLPIVIITSAEALRAVPGSIREAGFGVGATKWEVIRSHVLPSAAPGILTGTVLTIARALGETAPLLLVGAVLGFFSPGTGSFVQQLRGSYTALPTLIFSWAGTPNSEFRQLSAAAIVVLLAVLLSLQAMAILLRNKYERRW
jgi:phosphate transport system permease protein